MRLERKEQECDELKRKIEQLENRGIKEKHLIETNKTLTPTTQQNHVTDNHNMNYNIYNKAKENLVEPKKEEVVKDNINNLFQPSQDNKAKTGSTVSKSSALVRIILLL